MHATLPASQRVELSLEGKEADEKTRREGDTLSMERKFLDLMKRKLRKKRVIAEAARQVRKLIHVQAVCFRVDYNRSNSVRMYSNKYICFFSTPLEVS